MNGDNTSLRPIIKHEIERLITATGKINISDIVKIIEPLFSFNIDEAFQKALKSSVRSVIASIHDRYGDRAMYAIGRTGDYISLEICKSVDDLKSVYNLLMALENGFHQSKKRVSKMIDGQISFYEMPYSNNADDSELVAVGM